MQAYISEKFRFFDWPVYKDAKSLYQMVLELVKKLPKEYQRSIGDQLMRCGLSVVLNIAEGSGKHSDGDLGRFLNISMGSLYETFAVVDVMRENKLITAEEFGLVANKIHNIGNQIGGFKKTLKRK